MYIIILENAEIKKIIYRIKKKISPQILKKCFKKIL